MCEWCRQPIPRPRRLSNWEYQRRRFCSVAHTWAWRKSHRAELQRRVLDGLPRTAVPMVQPATASSCRKCGNPALHAVAGGLSCILCGSMVYDRHT